MEFFCLKSIKKIAKLSSNLFGKRRYLHRLCTTGYAVKSWEITQAT
jgi:hypothetical protein